MKKFKEYLNESDDYEAAKKRGADLEAKHNAATDALHSVPGHGSGPMGLTPDHVRATPEWQSAKRAAEKAFSALRNHNGDFVKHFAKEYKAERDARRAAILAKNKQGS
jgi:hypothetical protein